MSRLPSYTYLEADDWTARIAALDKIASSCALCPRACGVDRSKNEPGFCRAPGELVISSIFPHHGEEPPVSGTGGSGTVFFTHCTLQCVFCQNFQLSHEDVGKRYSPGELARELVSLQSSGCHNINLVTATHFLPWVLRALQIAAKSGLCIPIVYNCSGYERVEVMALLDGIVDIYLPDMKYGSNGPAAAYSNAPDYVEVNQAAVREMFRQVGPLRIDAEGIAYRGLCIRHLVLPNDEAGSMMILNYLGSTYDPTDLHISIMAQYRPLYKADTCSRINRMITSEEYEGVRREFIEKGFGGFCQELETMDRSFVIDFEKRKSERLTGNSNE